MKKYFVTTIIAVLFLLQEYLHRLHLPIKSKMQVIYLNMKKILQKMNLHRIMAEAIQLYIIFLQMQQTANLFSVKEFYILVHQ